MMKSATVVVGLSFVLTAQAIGEFSHRYEPSLYFVANNKSRTVANPYGLPLSWVDGEFSDQVLADIGVMYAAGYRLYIVRGPAGITGPQQQDWFGSFIDNPDAAQEWTEIGQAVAANYPGFRIVLYMGSQSPALRALHQAGASQQEYSEYVQEAFAVPLSNPQVFDIAVDTAGAWVHDGGPFANALLEVKAQVEAAGSAFWVEPHPLPGLPQTGTPSVAADHYGGWNYNGSNTPDVWASGPEYGGLRYVLINEWQNDAGTTAGVEALCRSWIEDHRAIPAFYGWQLIQSGQPLPSADTMRFLIGTHVRVHGDANGNGTVELNDLHYVYANRGATVMAWQGGDINGDGYVESLDIAEVLDALPPFMPGDTNQDFRVDNDDYNDLTANFYSDVLRYTGGDITGDGFVDFADYDELYTNFGRIYGDVDQSGTVDFFDVIAANSALGQTVTPWTGADLNGDGFVDNEDIQVLNIILDYYS